MRLSLLLLPLLLGFLLAPSLVRAQSHVYVGPQAACTGLGFATNAWECPLNWSAGTVPGAASTVSIGASTVAGTLSPSVASLALDGSSLTAAGSLGTAELDCTGCSINTGGTVTVTGTGSVFDGGTKFLTNTDLDIDPGAVVTWTAGRLYLQSGADVFNGGTFDAQADELVDFFSGAAVSFVNESTGAVTRTAGTGTATFDVNTLNQGGSFDVQSTTLRFAAGGTFTDGTYAAASGTTLLFDTGTYAVSGTLAGSPGGFVGHDNGATLSTDTDATLDFGNAGYQWNGGDLAGAGTWTNADLLVLSGSNAKFLTQATLQNDGTMAWDEGIFYLRTGAVVNNASLFDIQGNLTLDFFSGAVSAFNNAVTGTVRLSASGATTAQFDVVFNNDGGAVDVQADTLRFTSGGTLTGGTYTAALNARLLFDFGTYTASGTLSGTPDGFVGHDASATLTATGAATLAFGGAGYQWAGGSLDGPGAGLFTNTGLLVLTGAATKSLNGDNGGAVDPALRNAGTVSHEEGQLNVNASAGVENAGLYDLQGDVDVDYATGNAPAFTNEAAGTLRKSSGAAESTFDVFLANSGGAVEVVSGELHLTRSGALDGGTYEAGAGAVLLFDVGTFTATGTLTGSPAGFVGHDVTLTVVDGTAATLAFGGAGYQWAGGIVSAPGTGLLTNTGLFRLTGTATKSLNGDNTGFDLVLRNAGTVSHEEGQLNVNASAGVENAGLYDLQGDVDVDYATGSAPAFANEAGGTIEKSTGSGTSTVDIATTNEGGGIIQANAGTLAFTRSLNNQPDGLIEGDATFAPPTSASNTTLNGDVGPGTSPGLLNWTGNYAPKVGARLVAELGGLTPGTEHDQLVVSGTATLGGLLKIAFDTGYTPTVGDSFTILTAGSVAGEFDSVEEPAGWAFDVIYNAGSVVITAQAEEDVTAALTPQTGPADGPVVIPSSGGPVRYRARIRNTTAQPQTVDIWIEGLLPNGNVYQNSPLVGPVPRTLNPGQVLGPVPLAQPVPANIAAGVYAIRIRVGTYPDTVIDEDAFVIAKEEAPERVAGEAPIADRSVSGQGPAAAWTVYEVTDGEPLLAAATMTEEEVAAMEAAMREVADETTAREGDETAAREATDRADEAPVDEAPADEASSGESLPETFALHSATPNPFATRATLRYDLPEARSVRLVVYDLLGREVAVLVDAEQEAGRHAAMLDGRGLASGIYVVRLTVVGQAFTQRVTLTR